MLETIRNEFPELKTVNGDQLMYVKEDLIIPQVTMVPSLLVFWTFFEITKSPQTNTFYDFIVTKARGKSGPLFNFDLKEEEVAEEGLHTGKVNHDV